MFRYQKILVPLDGSEFAEKAVAPAMIIAEAMGAHVFLVQVTTPLNMTVDPDIHFRLQAATKEQASAYLKQLHAQHALPAVPTSVTALSGPVADSIVTYAAEHDVDLLVISSHGRSGISRLVYGSVARQMLQEAPCTVIIIRAGAEVPLFVHKRFLVPLDGSQLAEQVLAQTAALARTVAGELFLLRVAKNGGQAEEDEARAYLEQVRVSLTDDNMAGDRVHSAVKSGPVAETILDFAGQNQIDLIAMSSHARSGVSRWVLGSVTERVLEGTDCAMLVARET